MHQQKRKREKNEYRAIRYCLVSIVQSHVRRFYYVFANQPGINIV